MAEGQGARFRAKEADFVLFVENTEVGFVNAAVAETRGTRLEEGISVEHAPHVFSYQDWPNAVHAHATVPLTGCMTR